MNQDPITAVWVCPMSLFPDEPGSAAREVAIWRTLWVILRIAWPETEVFLYLDSMSGLILLLESLKNCSKELSLQSGPMSGSTFLSTLGSEITYDGSAGVMRLCFQMAAT